MQFVLIMTVCVSAISGLLLSLLTGSWVMMAVVCGFMGVSLVLGFLGTKLALAEDKEVSGEQDVTFVRRLHVDCR